MIHLIINIVITLLTIYFFVQTSKMQFKLKQMYQGDEHNGMRNANLIVIYMLIGICCIRSVLFLAEFYHYEDVPVIVDVIHYANTVLIFIIALFGYLFHNGSKFKFLNKI